MFHLERCTKQATFFTPVVSLFLICVCRISVFFSLITVLFSGLTYAMKRIFHIICGVAIALIVQNVYGLAQIGDIHQELTGNQAHIVDGGHGRSKRFVYPPNSGIGVSKSKKNYRFPLCFWSDSSIFIEKLHDKTFIIRKRSILSRNLLKAQNSMKTHRFPPVFVYFD